MAAARRRRGTAGLAVVLALLVLVSCGEPEADRGAAGEGVSAGESGPPAGPTEKASATIAPPEGEQATPEAVPPEHDAADDVAPPAEPEPEPAAPAGPDLPAGLLGQDIERIPTSSRVVGLTFDAGANADAVQPILATLDAEEVPGTFFLTGDFVERFPAAARSIQDAGHRLANHSISHPDFTSLTGDEIRTEVRGAEQDIQRVTGGDPRPFFRFPLGARDARTITAVNDLGYLAVRWSVDTLGWQGTSGGRTSAEVFQRVLDTARPGQIVLMHVGSHPTDGSTLDAEALPDVITGLREAGYRFVALDVLLG